MERKKLRTQRTPGGAVRINNESFKRRGNQVGVGPYLVERNQFFCTYSDGSREVRNIDIDYDDYAGDTYENIKKNIADNISCLRKEKELSCENIAKDVGVSRQYISQIENGERNVSLEVLAKIACSLDVSVEFLIKQNPFKPSNIYMDKLMAKLKELEPKRQKLICAEIIERLWRENDW